jgi:hypothetical protein
MLLLMDFVIAVLKKIKAFYVKKGNELSDEDVFNSNIITYIPYFVFLSFIIFQAVYLNSTYWKWANPDSKTLLDVKYIIVFIALNLRKLKLFQKNKLTAKTISKEVLLVEAFVFYEVLILMTIFHNSTDGNFLSTLNGSFIAVVPSVILLSTLMIYSFAYKRVV